MKHSQGRPWADLELQPVASISDPGADGVDVLPRGDRRHMPDDGNEVAFPARLHLEDGKAIAVVVEGHPLDRADERFPGRCCGERWFQRDTREMDERSAFYSISLVRHSQG